MIKENAVLAEYKRLFGFLCGCLEAEPVGTKEKNDLMPCG